MKVMDLNEDSCRVLIGFADLAIVKNALVETCKELTWDFETRVGVEKVAAEKLIDELNDLLEVMASRNLPES